MLFSKPLANTFGFYGVELGAQVNDRRRDHICYELRRFYEVVLLLGPTVS